jgi:cytochrome b pre-mRNA-processing protein 3
MLGWLRRNSLTGKIATELYGRVVAQARQPAFYAEYGVPDTTEGRFDVIVLHLFLVLERLRRDGRATETLGQALIEAFVADMDDSMREIGISDLGVPRRIKKTAAAMLERFEDYRAALAAADGGQLAGTLARHLGTSPTGADRIARYVREATTHIAAHPSEDLWSGPTAFPSI